MSELETKTIEILDKLENLATQYAPEVIDGVVRAIQVAGAAKLVTGIVFFLGAVAVGVVAKKCALYCYEKVDDEFSDWSIAGSVTLVFGAFAAVIFAVAAIAYLTNVWNWVAIFSPKIALAHKILGL